MYSREKKVKNLLVSLYLYIRLFPTGTRSKKRVKKRINKKEKTNRRLKRLKRERERERFTASKW